MLSRVLLRSNKRALIERTSSSIRAFGSGGGDGHFQPPFVQRARDTRKVGLFVFLSFFFRLISWWESWAARVHFSKKKKNALLKVVSEGCSLRTRSSMNKFQNTHILCILTHTFSSFHEQIHEQDELVWDDGVAPETCIDFDAPHVRYVRLLRLLHLL